MKLRFLGNPAEVGAESLILHHKGATLGFEYGMKVAKPPEFPLQAPPMDYIFLTHCHLDHSGMVPSLCGRFDTGVVSTPLTVDVSEILWYDSLKIAGYEGYSKPYSKADIETTLRNHVPMTFGESVDVAGFEITMHSAGHVPGAGMFELKGERTTVFTGDIHTYNTKLVWGAHPVKCDNLIVEATYAGKLHTDRMQTEQALIQKVHEVIERGGRVVVPSFAVGRTQEMMLMLMDMDYEKWVDGMGKSVTRFYLDHPEYLRSHKKLAKARRNFREVRSPSNRDKARKADIIVTTGGMLDGGPALTYIRDIKKDPKSAILLTGYQAEETNGRILIEQGMMNLGDGPERINCEVIKYDFSAHADHDELLSFIRACDPENVVLFHSDQPELLAQDLDGMNVILPKWDESFNLE